MSEAFRRYEAVVEHLLGDWEQRVMVRAVSEDAVRAYLESQGYVVFEIMEIGDD